MPKPDYRRAREWATGLTLVATLLGSGAFAGYWLCAYETREVIADMRASHLAEIARMQTGFGRDLGTVSGNVSTAARAAADAAEVAQGAAAVAGKAAKAAGVQGATIERDRKAINSTIQRANDALRGEGTP